VKGLEILEKRKRFLSWDIRDLILGYK